MNLNDAGMGSLRDAIAITPSGGTVDFQPGLTGTITLTTGELAINQDLSISGPGADVITVSGNNASRVFDLTGSGVAVTLAGLTIANGRADQGGGIQNSGTLTVSNCTVTGNTAGTDGGGIYNNRGTMAVTGSIISGNSVDSSGGGIYNFVGILTITGSTLSDNSIGGSFGQGGGIYNMFGMLTLTDSALTGNFVTGAGGGILTLNGTMTITDSAITGNSADASIFGDNAFGGGICIGGTGSTITGCTFSRNFATTYGGGIDGSVAIFNLNLTDSILTGNTAGTSGGGIYNSGDLTLTDSIISGNTAGTSGGGIYNSNSFSASVLTLTDSIISGNTAGTSGGGIYNNDGTLAVRGIVTIEGDYFQTSTGTLDVRIGGLQAGSQYDQLVVTGLATLDGTLQVNLTNGFVPQPGDRFQVLLFAQGQGTFSTYTGDVGRFAFFYAYGPTYDFATGLTLEAA
jgi:predicted outer membrane repeat protein